VLAGNDPRHIAIAGFITASGGGLTTADLAELTGFPEYELAGELAGGFGRILSSREPTDDRRDRQYLFAHEVLRKAASQALAGELRRYRTGIHEWAEQYRSASWPARTPGYLLRPYSWLLAAAGDTGRLLRLATDPRRHDRMLDRLYGDADAVAEIVSVQDLLRASAEPDVRSLALLSVYRDRLLGRNRDVPRLLPAVWVRLGYPDKAEAMARSIPEHGRDAALAAVAWALAETGQQDAAQRIADTIEGPAIRFSGRSGPATTVPALAAGDWDDAESTASAIADPGDRAKALAALARRIGDLDQDRAARLFDAADAAAAQIPVRWRRVAMVTGVATYMVRFDRDRALARAAEVAKVAHRFADEYGDRDEARILCEVVRTLSAAQEWDAARQILSEINEDDAHDAAVEALVMALASAGLWDRAEQEASGASEPAAAAELLTDLAGQLAAADPDRAVRMAIRAENLARQDWGEYDSWYDEIDGGLNLIKALAEAGEWDRAETLAALRDHRGHDAYAAIAEQLTARGLWDRAERTAGLAGDSEEGARALAALARAVAPADTARARRLAAQAEQVARGLSWPPSRLMALSLASEALSVTEPDRAADVLAEIRREAEALRSDEALPVLAAAAGAAAAIDPPLAVELAANIARIVRDGGVYLLSQGAELLASAHRDEALDLISLAEREIAADAEKFGPRLDSFGKSIWDDDREALVHALCLLGQWQRAEQLADQIHGPMAKANAEADLATALLAQASQSGPRKDLQARARRIVAGILATSGWMAALPAATATDPRTAIAVADALCDFMPHRIRQQ
jgi:hypothetical protein